MEKSGDHTNLWGEELTEDYLITLAQSRDRTLGLNDYPPTMMLTQKIVNGLIAARDESTDGIENFGLLGTKGRSIVVTPPLRGSEHFVGTRVVLQKISDAFLTEGIDGLVAVYHSHRPTSKEINNMYREQAAKGKGYTGDGFSDGDFYHFINWFGDKIPLMILLDGTHKVFCFKSQATSGPNFKSTYKSEEKFKGVWRGIRKKFKESSWQTNQRIAKKYGLALYLSEIEEKKLTKI